MVLIYFHKYNVNIVKKIQYQYYIKIIMYVLKIHLYKIILQIVLNIDVKMIIH